MFINEKQINETNDYQKFSKDIDSLIDFFDSFYQLFIYNGRVISYYYNNQYFILDGTLIQSTTQTLRSIKLSCSIGSFSDANTLIRKVRDDLFQFLFILHIVNSKSSQFEENLNPNENQQAVLAWFGNTVKDLPKKIKKKLEFENYMTVLKENNAVQKILDEYKLENYWDTLRRKLNDYVHNNGIMYCRQNFVEVDNKYLNIHFEDSITRLDYISSLFLSLLLMIDSAIIMSSDYIDHMDMNMEPPENSQLWIPDFAQNFIDTKVTKLHPELKQFIKENNINGMRIE